MAHRGTVECYDCHTQVADLKSHRNVCVNSRKNKTKVSHSLGHSVEQKLPSNVGNFVNTVDRYLLIDASGSMAGTRIANVKQVVNEVFPTFAENDRIAIVTFDTTPYFRLKPRPVGQIRRQNELPDVLARIKTLGGTAIWDAIYMVVSQIRDKSRKTVLSVITDGEDNSSKHTLAEVNELLRQFPNVILDIVHVGDVVSVSYQSVATTYVMIEEIEIVSTYRKTILQRV